jgi:hypothetical protein
MKLSKLWAFIILVAAKLVITKSSENNTQYLLLNVKFRSSKATHNLLGSELNRKTKSN